MAFYDLAWYANSVGYTAVTAWATGATIAAGALRRQNAAPAVNSERVFIAIVGGTTHATTEPTWVITRGAKTTDNTVTWQECTGASAVNGDLTNTPTWAAAKAINSAVTLGAIIQRNNGASYWICSTAGTMGASEPAWSNNTAGTTQADGTVTWTCLGVVGNFTGGQAPHARLPNAATTNWFAAGNSIYVGDNHAESQASSNTISVAGSAGLISKIICHNHLGPYPPASGNIMAGASIAVSGNFSLTFTSAGSVYVYGITFKGGVGSSSGGAAFVSVLTNNLATQSWIFFDNCSLQVATTGANAAIQLGPNAANNTAVIVLNNTTVSFAATSQFIQPSYSQMYWQNTGQVLASGSSVPTTLFSQASVVGPTNNVVLEALDLSQIAGSVVPGNLSSMGNFSIKDCKLNATMALSTPSSSGLTVQSVRSDSGATGYKSARYTYEGTETTETSITRVGGASDPTGQAQSRKIVTTANAQWLRPFKAEPYAIWNPTTGANVTVTVYGTINAGALPNNDDIWLEVEYLGSSSTPLGTIVTTTKANLLAANAAVASDGSTWNGGGSGAGWLPFKLTATLSSPQPGMAGYLHARVRAAKPSTTWYLDPKITLS
jgi:hypothetical protein